MKILLVNPLPTATGINLVDSLQARINLTVDIELFHLSALTPPATNVVISDAHAADLPLEEVDLVYATGKTRQAAELYRIAQRCRAGGVPAVLGGPHVTALPEEASDVADSIIIGESEPVWSMIIEDITTHGTLKPVYRAESPMTSDDLSEKLRVFLQTNPTAFQKKRYPTLLAPLAPGNHGRNDHQTKSVETVVAEIEAAQAAQTFFKDTNLLSVDTLPSVLEALQMKDQSWSGEIVLGDRSVDSSLAYTMGMGAKAILFKVDPLASSYTNVMNTHASFIDQLIEKGVIPWFSFTIGFDHDPEDVCEEIYQIADQYALGRVSVRLLTPAPGTALFTTLEEQGRIIDRRWEHYDGTHVVFEPPHRSARSLEERYRSLVRKVNRLAFRRMTIALNS